MTTIDEVTTGASEDDDLSRYDMGEDIRPGDVNDEDTDDAVDADDAEVDGGEAEADADDATTEDDTADAGAEVPAAAAKEAVRVPLAEVQRERVKRQQAEAELSQLRQAQAEAQARADDAKYGEGLAKLNAKRQAIIDEYVREAEAFEPGSPELQRLDRWVEAEGAALKAAEATLKAEYGTAKEARERASADAFMARVSAGEAVHGSEASKAAHRALCEFFGDGDFEAGAPEVYRMMSQKADPVGWLMGRAAKLAGAAVPASAAAAKTAPGKQMKGTAVARSGGNVGAGRPPAWVKTDPATWTREQHALADKNGW